MIFILTGTLRVWLGQWLQLVVNELLPKDALNPISLEHHVSYMKTAALPGPVEGMKLFFAREALIVLGPRTEGVHLGD